MKKFILFLASMVVLIPSYSFCEESTSVKADKVVEVELPEHTKYPSDSDIINEHEWFFDDIIDETESK
jgi:hypothetical protein